MEAGGPAALSGKIEGLDTLIAVNGTAVTGTSLIFKNTAFVFSATIPLQKTVECWTECAMAGLEYKELARLVLGPEGSCVDLAIISHSANASKEV